MSARSVLEKASNAGVQIRASDGQISLRGDERAVAELLHDVKAFKAEILVWLAANDPVLPPELDELIGLVAKYHGFSFSETKEAREIAAGDVANALTCFRALERKSGSRMRIQTDPRVVAPPKAS